MKTLIFGGVYLKSEDAGNLMRTSLALAERLNPGVDVLMVDNFSPLDPRKFLDGSWNDMGLCLRDGLIPTIGCGKTIARFPDSIGHFFHDAGKDPPPKDGPGRGIMTALKVAIKSGYDRAVYMEPDCLVAKPVEFGFERMKKPTAFLPRTPWGYLDNQVWWCNDLRWLEEFDFVGKYDWPSRVGDRHGEPPGESLWERILDGHLDVVPLRGCRTSMLTVNSANLRRTFPEGIDFITHADRETNKTFLEMNGHADLIPLLGTNEDWNAIGIALSENAAFDAARVAFIKALSVQRRPDTLANYANTLRRNWRYSDAYKAIGEALSLDAERGRSWWIDGLIKLDRFAYAGALNSLNIAHAKHPDLPHIQVGQAIANLSAGNWFKGFEGCEVRHKINAPRRCDVPDWQGENLSGKRLLVDCEQGFGDVVMFSRFLAMLDCEMVVRAPPPMVRYLRGQGYPAVSKANEIKADYRAMIMSLPYLLGVDCCPAPPEPMKPEPITLAGKGKFNIGIVWRSKSQGENDLEYIHHGQQKSCDIEQFLTLAEIPGVQLHSLQVGLGSEDINRAAKIVNPLMIHDFEDLAGFIQNMDLVVSVDTAPIHVCGALGKPGVVMLNYVGSWQWQDKDTTPWYPSLKIVRQPKPFDWTGAFAECRKLVGAML